MEACREWQATIVDYVDGRCEPETAHELESHMASCEACRRALQAQQWIKQEVAQVPPQHAPAHLSRRIRDRARTARRQQAVARLWLRASFALTAVILLVALVWLHGVRQSSSRIYPEEPTLVQAIVQEYVGATAHDGFSDPSLQMLEREAQLKRVRVELVSQ